MKRTNKILICTIVSLLLFGCDLLEDECEESKKPEKNFYIYMGGIVKYPDECQTPNLVVQIDFYKEHCNGSLSETFTYGCSADKDCIFQSCNIGYSYGFIMDNSEDKIHFTFKYRRSDEEQYQIFDQVSLTYSDFDNCAEYPPTLKADVVFQIEMSDYENLVPAVDKVSFLKVGNCK